jgi:hypothetical protein
LVTTEVEAFASLALRVIDDQTVNFHSPTPVRMIMYRGKLEDSLAPRVFR